MIVRDFRWFCSLPVFEANFCISSVEKANMKKEKAKKDTDVQLVTKYFWWVVNWKGNMLKKKKESLFTYKQGDQIQHVTDLTMTMGTQV